MFGSTKAPGLVTRWKRWLNTSTLPLWKSVAYKCAPSAVDAIASPLKIACSLRISTTRNAVVDGAGGGTFGFHARITPLSVSNRNKAGAVAPFFETLKPVPPLNTAPVGAPATLTTNGTALPLPSYSVEVLEWLFATHHGVLGPATKPHAFTRFGSWCAALFAWSETRRVTL